MTVVEHHSAEDLQALFRKEPNARIAKRVWIVWQARLGRSSRRSRRRSDCRGVRCKNGAAVQRGRTRRVAGDRPGRGRRPILSAEERQAVDLRVLQGPQDGAPCSLRGLDMQQFLEDQFGKLMSLSSVYGLLRQLGYE